MKLLIRCGIQQERISECMDWVKTHAGRNPARALSSAFFFGRLKRQAALNNTVKSPVAKKDSCSLRTPGYDPAAARINRIPRKGRTPVSCRYANPLGSKPVKGSVYDKVGRTDLRYLYSRGRYSDKGPSLRLVGVTG
jgi:hypothetical protein